MKDSIEELEKLFHEAKQKSEFEFVISILNYKSIGGDETSNLSEWFEAIEFYKSLFYKLEGNEKTRIGCMLYSTFFENSDFYNILGNLCHNILGYRGSSFLYWKTKKYERLLGTGEKISLVSEILEDCHKSLIVKFFTENHYQEIRNTFFHSAYSLTDNNYILHDSDYIVIEGVGQRYFSVTEFLYPKIENVILFFEKFKALYLEIFSSYTEDKVVKGFFPVHTDVTILGSEKGLVGYEVKNTARFFGEWVDSGVYYDDEHQIWYAKNIEVIFPRVEDIEIEQQIQRYAAKDDIKLSNADFFNLLDKVVERNRIAEIDQLIILLIKFGHIQFEKWVKEANLYRKKSLIKMVLPYYTRAVALNKRFDMKNIHERIKQLELGQSI